MKTYSSSASFSNCITSSSSSVAALGPFKLNAFSRSDSKISGVISSSESLPSEDQDELEPESESESESELEEVD